MYVNENGDSMILVEQYGVPKYKQEHVSRAVKYAIKQLLPRHRNLDIEVRMTDIGDVYGYCYPEADCIVVELSKKLHLADLYSTIFHEMVHAKQYVRKELCMEGKIKWKGQVVRGAAKDPGGINMPYEKEAYAREMTMFIEFFESLNDNRLKGRMRYMYDYYTGVVEELNK